MSHPVDCRTVPYTLRVFGARCVLLFCDILSASCLSLITSRPSRLRILSLLVIASSCSSFGRGSEPAGFWGVWGESVRCCTAPQGREIWCFVCWNTPELKRTFSQIIWQPRQPRQSDIFWDLGLYWFFCRFTGIGMSTEHCWMVWDEYARVWLGWSDMSRQCGIHIEIQTLYSRTLRSLIVARET